MFLSTLHLHLEQKFLQFDVKVGPWQNSTRHSGRINSSPPHKWIVEAPPTKQNDGIELELGGTFFSPVVVPFLPMNPPAKYHFFEKGRFIT
jgi:hypothetical protein